MPSEKQQKVEKEYAELMYGYVKRTPEEIQRFWRRNTDIEAWIDSVDELGVLKVRFSRNITVQNTTAVDSAVLRVEVVPHIQHNNVTKLEFSFNCTEFRPDYLTLQLDFNEPAYVSYQGVDKILVRVLKDGFFYVSEEVLVVGPNRKLKKSLSGSELFVPRRYMMVHTLPRQMEDAVTGRQVKAAMQVVE